MTYQHRWQNGNTVMLPVGKVVCVGRNYADHAKELNNEVPDEPLLFLKPATALQATEEVIRIPTRRGTVHFETEIAILIGSTLCKANEEEARDAIVGLGLGLDLTLRDLQNQLKAKGQPWERAKAFDGACAVTPFIPIDSVSDLDDVSLMMRCNGTLRQSGNSREMLFRILPLLVNMSEWFTLQPGDIVLTGTPAGVGPLSLGDQIILTLQGHTLASVDVIAD